MPDSENPRDHTELRGVMRWWRGLGLGVVLLAVYLFSIEQDIVGYIALGVGWAILIYAIIARTRHNRRRMDERTD